VELVSVLGDVSTTIHADWGKPLSFDTLHCLQANTLHAHPKSSNSMRRWISLASGT
jgi:hypothetical protein